MTTEPRPEATRLEAAFPVSYAIFAMARVHRAIAASQLGRLGLFPNQEIMIVQLSGQDGVPQKVLAQTLRISHVTVAKTVQRMERAGFVRRETSSQDRRVSLVYLTDEGRALGEAIVSAWAELERITTAGLDEELTRGFLAATAAIRPHLDEAAGDLNQPAGPH